MNRPLINLFRSALDDAPVWQWFAVATVVVGVAAFKIAVLVLPHPAIMAPSSPRQAGPPPASAPARVTSGALVGVPRPISAKSADRLEAIFDRADYRLAAIRSGRAVPRLSLNELPADLAEVTPVAARKRLFIRTVLPLILEANARVAADRTRLLALLASIETGATLGRRDTRWLAAISKRYRVSGAKTGDSKPPSGISAVLRRRVDGVPPSLAVAQAIVESGWGTSRFARDGNALFGQWIWGDTDDGLVPANRPTGAQHEVRAFDTLQASVDAYLLNLNGHRAYAGFRRARVGMRDRGAPLDGAELAGQLTRYSSRGDAYVSELRTVIEQNDLAALDGATLQSRRGARPVKPGS